MTEICDHCQKPIEDPREAWREITSWVSPHGGKSSTLAKGTGRLMHESCVQLAKSGVPVQQETLV